MSCAVHPATARWQVVLLVEDEAILRGMLADELRDNGFHVVEAATADEALDRLDRNIAVDLVISDVRMPGRLDGLDLLDHIRRSHPGLPVILASGDLAASDAIGRGAAGFLAKPYSTLSALTLITALPV